MRHRTIRLREDLDRRIERRARERGTTYSEAVREVLEQAFAATDESPNEWILKSIGIVDSGGNFPAIDSDGGQDLLHGHRRSRSSSSSK